MAQALAVSRSLLRLLPELPLHHAAHGPLPTSFARREAKRRHKLHPIAFAAIEPPFEQQQEPPWPRQQRQSAPTRRTPPPSLRSPIANARPSRSATRRAATSFSN